MAHRADELERSTHALDWGGRFAAGIVECGTNRLSWLPYVGVAHIEDVTERARRFWCRRPLRAA
jgi:hypothetical protein